MMEIFLGKEGVEMLDAITIEANVMLQLQLQSAKVMVEMFVGGRADNLIRWPA